MSVRSYQSGLVAPARWGVTRRPPDFGIESFRGVVEKSRKPVGSKADAVAEYAAVPAFNTLNSNDIPSKK